jgi:peroxiredoxin Q/BCP
MPMLEAGAKAPAFALADQEGKTVKLTDFKGKRVILYFYPRDNTPGCTREACGFRDEHPRFDAASAVVLGISGDSQESHAKFAGKFTLPFRLLVDKDHAVALKYGAWGEKTMYGKKVTGMIRSTFLIGPEGKIEKVWSNVKVDGHVAKVLEALSG